MAAPAGTAPRYRTAAALISLTAHMWCAYGLPGKNTQVGILFKETTTTQITYLKLHNKAQKNSFINQTSNSSKGSWNWLETQKNTQLSCSSEYILLYIYI